MSHLQGCTDIFKTLLFYLKFWFSEESCFKRWWMIRRFKSQHVFHLLFLFSRSEVRNSRDLCGRSDLSARRNHQAQDPNDSKACSKGLLQNNKIRKTVILIKNIQKFVKNNKNQKNTKRKTVILMDRFVHNGKSLTDT